MSSIQNGNKVPVVRIAIRANVTKNKCEKCANYDRKEKLWDNERSKQSTEAKATWIKHLDARFVSLRSNRIFRSGNDCGGSCFKCNTNTNDMMQWDWHVVHIAQNIISRYISFHLWSRRLSTFGMPLLLVLVFSLFFSFFLFLFFHFNSSIQKRFGALCGVFSSRAKYHLKLWWRWIRFFPRRFSHVFTAPRKTSARCSALTCMVHDFDLCNPIVCIMCVRCVGVCMSVGLND